MGFLDVLRRLLGKGSGSRPAWGVPELARRLGLTVDQFLAVEPSYRRFTIPKRWGERRIAAPSPDLRELQRRILRRVLSRLRVHPAVQGFERGRSIVTNALPHAGKRVVVRLDLRNFFESTSAERVERYFRRVGWDPKASRLLMIHCTLDGSLPQGAPTSPRLSNLVNFRHQRRKLQIRRRNDRQVVTGLVVNAAVNLPRSTRSRLRAVKHHAATGRPATLTPAQVAGWDSLFSMVKTQAGRGNPHA